MIENLPLFISIVFGLTTVLTVVLFYIAFKNSSLSSSSAIAIFSSIILLLWLIVQAVLTVNNFYNTNTASFPPKFLLLVFPPLLTIIILFNTRKGRNFIDNLPLVSITYIHIVRIPVELTLYWLFVQKAVPELMTFSGRNFDILSGLSAPFIAYYGLKQQKLSYRFILIWNFIALALLLNIVINAVLAAPFAFQQFAFEQPNVAVLNFPFSWLPSFIVPVVLFAHLATIRHLLIKINNTSL